MLCIRVVLRDELRDEVGALPGGSPSRALRLGPYGRDMGSISALGHWLHVLYSLSPIASYQTLTVSS